MSRSSSILESASKVLIKRISVPGGSLPFELPVEIAKEIEPLVKEGKKDAAEAWRELYRADTSERRKYPDDAMKTLIVLVGTAVLSRLLPSEPRDLRGGVPWQYEIPRPATLLLAVGVADVTRLLSESPNRELTKDCADELRRIARWIWHGEPQKIEEFWAKVPDSASATSDSPYDLNLIRVDLERTDERFNSSSAIGRAEAFKDLISSVSRPFAISGRVSSDILQSIPFQRL